MCKTISTIPSVSLAAFLFYALRNKDKSSDGADKFKAESSTEMERLKIITTRYAIIMMMINSPILFIVSAVCALFFWLLGKISQMTVFARTESFIGNLPETA
jgi:hypothetical protein